LSDRVARHVLSFKHQDFKAYSFLDRGSDERQYCSPGIDLPIASITRSKYHEYPEYHTSLDNLNFVTKSGLYGSLSLYKEIVKCIENNYLVKSLILCEPQLGRRNLYPKFTTKTNIDRIKGIKNLIAYADGRSMIEIAELIRIPFWELQELLNILVKENILTIE